MFAGLFRFTGQKTGQIKSAQHLPEVVLLGCLVHVVVLEWHLPLVHLKRCSHKFKRAGFCDLENPGEGVNQGYLSASRAAQDAWRHHGAELIKLWSLSLLVFFTSQCARDGGMDDCLVLVGFWRGLPASYLVVPKLNVMKHLMTLVALLVSTAAVAQIPTFPWNPDGNGDGVIGSSDLIELLTVYGQEFQNAIVSENQESALVYVGYMGLFQCKYSCSNLPGNWMLPQPEDLVAVIDSLIAADYDTWDGEHFWVTDNFPGTGKVNADNVIFPEDWTDLRYPYLRAFLQDDGQIDMKVRHIVDESTLRQCFCSIKQLPRVEYSACADVINDPGCANQLVSDGWYPMGSVSDSGTQAFWRFAQ